MSNSVFKTKISSGVLFALSSAALFGASTPLSKILLGDLSPVLLAGLLYLSSGCGLAVWRLLRRLFGAADVHEASLKSEDLPWLAGAILAGGVIGPALLMMGRFTHRHRESHSHAHAHVGLLHRHPHYPDIHHRH
jgi:drug/metabolite transporter (DMT)-like permease